MRFTVLIMALSFFVCSCSGGSDSPVPSEDLLTDGQGDLSGLPDGLEPETDAVGNETLEETLDDETSSDSVVGPSVRAFVVTQESELIPGRQAVGRIGDIRIENSRLTAIIGAIDHSGWGPFGGGILDLAPAGGEDYFEEQFNVAGLLRTIHPDSLEVVKDGSDGEAVIRLTGRDAPIPLVAFVLPVPPANVDVTVEYILKEDSDCLEVKTTITNDQSSEISVPVGDAVVFSESGATFGSGAGYDTAALAQQGTVDFLGSEQPEVSYLLTPSTGREMSVVLTEQELNAVQYSPLVLAPGESGSVSRCFRTDFGRSLKPLKSFWTARNMPLYEVIADVLLETPDYPLNTLALEVWKDGGFFGAASPDEAGHFSFSLPAGDYEGRLVGSGFAPVVVNWSLSDQAPLEPLVLDPTDPGRLDVAIVDGDENPVPARITIQSGADAPFSAGRVTMAPDLYGKKSFFLAPGDYTVQGSRGPEYSFCRVNATLVEGQVTSSSCSIQHELEIPGWIQGDLHVHSEFSIDSHILREERMKAHVAEGVFFMANTEHDVFTDYASIVKDLGWEEFIFPSSGIEVSPVGRHFNGLGCKPTAEQLLVYFVIPWVLFTETGEVGGAILPPALWQSMREDLHCKVVQINHPRDGQGYLDFAGYDPAVGPASAKPGLFDFTFDAVEVWNSSDSWAHMRDATLPDWYSFLNRGEVIIATGNADTHDLSQWAGQPRNLVPVEGTLTEDGFYDALLAGRSQVSSAPFITFTLDGKTLGSTVVPETSGSSVMASVRVEAASWVPLDTVLLIGNGEIVQQWDVSGTQGLVRLDTAIELMPLQDTWYHVIAVDLDETLTPLYPGRTCAALTNPIWVDRDGDGFDPPITD